MRHRFFYFLVVAFSFVWSSAFIAASIALRDTGPFVLLTIRFLISTVLLFPLCAFFGHGTFDRRTIVAGVVLGLLNNAIYLSLSFSALQTLRPEFVIVIVSCAPFATSLIAAAFGVEKLDGQTMAGIAIGFVGVVVVSGIGVEAPDWRGFAYAAIGTVAFAAGTVIFRRESGRLPVLQTNLWQSISGGLALLPIALYLGEPFVLPSVPTVAALLYLAVVVTIGGMGLWLILIRTSGAAVAASYHLMNPVFGIILSYLVLGAPLRAADFVGAALIAFGLTITMRARRAKPA